MSNPEQQPAGRKAHELIAEVLLAIRRSSTSEDDYRRKLSDQFQMAHELTDERLRSLTSQQSPSQQPMHANTESKHEPQAEVQESAQHTDEVQAVDEQLINKAENYVIKPGETKLFPITIDEIPYVHTDPNVERPHHVMAGVKAVFQAEVPVQFGIDGSVLSTARTDEGVVFTDIDEMRHHHRRAVLEHFIIKEFNKRLQKEGITDPQEIELLTKKNIESGRAFMAAKAAEVVAMVSTPFSPDDGKRITIPESATWMQVGLNGVDYDFVDVFLHKERNDDGSLKLRLDTAPPDEPHPLSHIMRVGVCAGNIAVHTLAFTELEEAMYFSNENGPQVLVSSASQPINESDIDNPVIAGFLEHISSKRRRLPVGVDREPVTDPEPEPETRHNSPAKQKQSTYGTSRTTHNQTEKNAVPNVGQKDQDNPFSVLDGVAAPLIETPVPSLLSRRDIRRINNQKKYLRQVMSGK